MTLAGQQPSNHPAEATALGWDERRQQKVLTALVAEVKDYAIVMLDVEGKVATWIAGARRFKGYEAPEIIGRHFSVFYPPEDVAAGKPVRVLELAAADGRVEDEGWRVRKDGSRFWADVVITAVRDRDGVLLGYGKITRDLTERQRAGAEPQSAVLAGAEPLNLRQTGIDDRTLISAVVQIARGMGKPTIAEFVGDQDSVDILTDIGVDYGQGYFLGRPEPLTQHLAAQPAAPAAARRSGH